MEYELTNEQKEILVKVKESKNKGPIGVNAIAGSGKTAILLALVDYIKPKKCFYTAFNRKLVEESREKFSTNVECKTFHAMAYRYVQPKLGVEPFTYLCVKEPLNYQSKAKIIKGMDAFFISDSTDMQVFLESIIEDERLIPIIIMYIEKMVNEEIPMTFNFMLKYLHLLLNDNLIEIKYDMVLIDECQDVSMVTLEILKLLTSDYKVLVGDPHQNIYSSFMNTVNAFRVLDMPILGLTKSFRCSEAISQRIENYGITNLDKDFMFKGTSTPETDGKLAYITATNAQIILRIIKLHESNTGYVLTRPLKDIFACALALVTAASGKRVMHKQYKFLDKEYTNYTMSGKKGFYSYLNKKTKDEEIKNATGLLMKLKERDINIFEVLAKAKTMKKDRDVLVSTAYSCKGLGFETVHIENDLNGAVKDALKAKKEECMTEANYTSLKLGYVGASRCKINLINCDYL